MKKFVFALVAAMVLSTNVFAAEPSGGCTWLPEGARISAIYSGDYDTPDGMVYIVLNQDDKSNTMFKLNLSSNHAKYIYANAMTAMLNDKVTHICYDPGSVVDSNGWMFADIYRLLIVN